MQAPAEPAGSVPRLRAFRSSRAGLFMKRVKEGEVLTAAAARNVVVSIAAGEKRSPKRRAGRGRTFYETEMVKRGGSAIDYAVEHSAIVLISAGFGAGKTEATKLWRQSHWEIDSALFEFDTFTSSHIYEFLGALAAQLGMDADAYYHNSGKVFRMVVERLREQPTVLIFDQCEMVRVRILQLVRQIWDQTKEDGVAVVLLAAPQLYHRLERGRGGRPRRAQQPDRRSRHITRRDPCRHGGNPQSGGHNLDRRRRGGLVSSDRWVDALAHGGDRST